MRLVLALVFLCCAPIAGRSAGHAAESICKLPRGVAADGMDVAEGGGLRLKDGREVRLLGLHAPQQAIGRAAAEPMAAEAQAFLSRWAKGQGVLLHQFPNAKEDRYGRLLAHVTRAQDGAWLQAHMIEAGHARVQGTRDSRSCLSILLEKEEGARAVGRGLWAEDYYSVRMAADTGQLLELEGSYQLVEGTIASVARRNKRLYFNFGDDWRTDFTVTVDPAEAKLFLSADKAISPAQQMEKLRAAWEGKRVRVRGWLGKYNGPAMQLTYPEQIEPLDKQAGTESGNAR